MKRKRLQAVAVTLFCLFILSLLSLAQTPATAVPPQSGQSALQGQTAPSPSPSKPQTGSQDQQTTSPAQLPNAPSSSKTEPSLEDLGFSTSQTQRDAQRQALLDKRTHMLKVHQRLGLIAAIPITASVITSVNAGGKDTS